MAKTAKKGQLKEVPNVGHNSGKASAEEMLQYYKDMLLIRRFEEKAGQLYGMGLIGGFCHLYIGQEAVVVGARAATEDGDGCVTGYRDHGHCLMWGMTPKSVMAELTGRAEGCSKGKGGSMHMFNTETNYFGGHGIVGASGPLGAGMAFAHKYNEDGNVTLTFFGDGAANQGQVYEAMNMASIWKLPTVFIIENNGYAMGTSVKRSAAGTAFANRGAGFDIPGEQVDGMDVVAVRDAIKGAAEKCRKGEGPQILEVMTYRYRGHSMSDPAKYRSKDEVKDMKTNNDPIENAKKRIFDEGFATEDELKQMDKEIKQEIKEAAEFAQEAPEPDESELWTDIYVEDK